jgi:hypothetical protein
MTDWYDVTGAPGTKAEGASLTIRTEFNLISQAMANLPTYTGAGDEIVVVNTGGTALETMTQEALAAILGPLIIADLYIVENPDESSTDNALVRWSGTDGDTIQDSGIIVDDDDNVSGASQLSSTKTDDYTTVAGDKGTTIYLNAATAKTLTIAHPEDVTYAVNTRIEFINLGAGAWTIAMGIDLLEPDDTVISLDGAVEIAQYQAATITKYGSGTWILNGGLS